MSSALLYVLGLVFVLLCLVASFTHSRFISTLKREDPTTWSSLGLSNSPLDSSIGQTMRLAKWLWTSEYRQLHNSRLDAFALVAKVSSAASVVLLLAIALLIELA